MDRALEGEQPRETKYQKKQILILISMLYKAEKRHVDINFPDL